MSASTPIVVLEDQWHQRGVAADLGVALARAVTIVDSFEALISEVERYAGDPLLDEPLILLDPGVPGICRLETTSRALEVLPRARIVVWTADRNVCTHAGALIDGAFASLPKTSPLSTVSRVVERVSTGRRWVEPDQAQWFADFLDCIERQVTGEPGKTWQSSELQRWHDLTATTHPTPAELRDRVLHLAQGAPMPVDDSWFRRLTDLLAPLWLTPPLRRSLVALALHATRKEAAEAVGISVRTIDGDATSLSGRLMPSLVGTNNDGSNSHRLVRLVASMHEGCELSASDHNLGARGGRKVRR